MKQTLEEFATKVNDNQKVRIIAANWSPNIILEPLGDGPRYTLKIREAQVAEIEDGVVESDHAIRMEGEEATLDEIFKGHINPSMAVLAGDIAIFGEPADHIKLDAISMLVWG